MFSKLNKKINIFLQKFKIILNIDTNYKLANHNLILPASHPLPYYQKRHKLYDKFLPHISKFLENNSTIIDVGANCGDTLVAMYHNNKNLNYVCIEMNNFFFKNYLKKNIDNLKISKNKNKIQCFNIEINNKKNNSLDELVQKNKINKISFLKSDVDGYDYDIINSSKKTITKFKPIIFFELQVDNLSQKKLYENTINNLKKLNYNHWYIFDNYGEFILKTNNILQVLQLINYTWKQNKKETTRTIHYYDILICQDKNKLLIDKVIKKYELR